MLSEGNTVGPYALIRKLGEGAFGEVWLARHIDLDDIRALKIPTDNSYKQQLRHEGKIQFGVRHPNIVQTLDLNTQNDPPYFAMEYVDGTDLRRHLRGQGSLALDEALRTIGQILEALQAAHAKGVVHRDLKPENILLTADGTVKVSDFGLGKVKAEVAQSLLVSGSMVSTDGKSISGTIEYMSPEQRDAAAPDPRDDLYAVGVIGCELLTGSRPSLSGVAVALERAGVPTEVIAVLQKACDELRYRYSSAFEMLTDLRPAPPGPAPIEAVAESEAVVPAAFDTGEPPLAGVPVEDEELVLPVEQDLAPPALNGAPPRAEEPPRVAAPPPMPGRRRGFPAVATALVGIVLAVGVLGLLLFVLRGKSEWPGPGPAPNPAPRLLEAPRGWPFDKAEAERRLSAAERTGLQRTQFVGQDRFGASLFGGEEPLTMVLIPQGDLMMGSPDAEPGHQKNEAQRPARIQEPFYISATEVTVGHFHAFYKSRTSEKLPAKSEEPKGKGGTEPRPAGLTWQPPVSVSSYYRQPVVGVSWHDAKAFCDWLSQRTGKRISLPTEAQWEYACRAGSAARFPFGEHDKGLYDHTWFINSAKGELHDVPYPGKSSIQPNHWGVYNMLGNAREWCASPYAEQLDGSEAQGMNVTTEHLERVIRGGSASDDADGCRSARRSGEAPTYTHPKLGFRVVMAAERSGKYEEPAKK